MLMLLLALAAIVAAGYESTTTQADMNICAADRFARADAALNAQFRRTYTTLHGRAKLLLTAQRAWLAFRDAECTVEAAGSVGGTIHALDVAECRTRLTTDRTHQLADLAKGR
jgi:uncharacterized protein YecT (DUF1311 family)